MQLYDRLDQIDTRLSAGDAQLATLRGDVSRLEGKVDLVVDLMQASKAGPTLDLSTKWGSVKGGAGWVALVSMIAGVVVVLGWLL
jgi:hypothetical protein